MHNDYKSVPIRAVIFDLGKVLVPFEFARAYQQFQAIAGYPLDELRKRAGNTGLVPQYEAGLIDSSDFIDRLSQALALPVSHDQFREIWNSIFLQHPLVPDAMVEGIKRRYPIVLLSNTNRMHFEMLDRTYPILRHFDKRVLSYEVRSLKPEPEIYAEAVKLAGVQPAECFFVDDIPEYVEGALRAGIDAVQFVSVPQLEADLQARGIRWD